MCTNNYIVGIPKIGFRTIYESNRTGSANYIQTIFIFWNVAIEHVVKPIFSNPAVVEIHWF